MLKMACNALCYRVLITCYLHMHSIVSDQRNRKKQRGWRRRRCKRKKNYYELWCHYGWMLKNEKKTQKEPHEHRNDIYILYKSLENGNFMRVSQMNWAIFIQCLRHPRRFRLRFLTHFVLFEQHNALSHVYTYTWLLYYVCVLMKNQNFFNNYMRLVSIFLCLWIFGLVASCAHDYYQIWSKSYFERRHFIWFVSMVHSARLRGTAEPQSKELRWN